MLPRLTELMFVDILRQHMQTLSADEVGWFATVNDPVVGPALKRLHAAPLEEWNVDRQARQVGVSPPYWLRASSISRPAADALPDILAPATRGPSPEGDGRADEGHS